VLNSKKAEANKAKNSMIQAQLMKIKSQNTLNQKMRAADQLQLSARYA
jgi:hypothetical protein